MRKRLDESLSMTAIYKAMGRYDLLPKIDTEKIYIDKNGNLQLKEIKSSTRSKS